MAFDGIGASRLPGAQPIVDMAPMFGCDIAGIEALSLHLVYGFKAQANFRPALYRQQQFAARPHEGYSGVGIAGTNGAQDVDAGMHRSIVVGRPPDECDDRIGPEQNDTALATEDAFAGNAAEAYPVLKPLLNPYQ